MTSFRFLAVWAAVFGLLVPPPVWNTAQAQTTITQRAGTTVLSSGTVHDITTNRTGDSGRNAFNSFNRFDIGAGDTANLYIPNTATNLINLIHDTKRSEIHGTVNAGYGTPGSSMQIAGNTYFLNSHGFLIGPTGAMNVGSLTMITPTSGFMDQLENMDATAVTRLTTFGAVNVPISKGGLITVKGTINAVDTIILRANKVELQDENTRQNNFIQAGYGTTVSADFREAVNTGNLESANWMSTTPEGKIIIGAKTVENEAGTIEFTAGSISTGTDPTAAPDEVQHAGSVTLEADHAVRTSKGTYLTAASYTGNAGTVEIDSGGDMTLQGNIQIGGLDFDPDVAQVRLTAAENLHLYGSVYTWNQTGVLADGSIHVGSIDISGKNVVLKPGSSVVAQYSYDRDGRQPSKVIGAISIAATEKLLTEETSDALALVAAPTVDLEAGKEMTLTGLVLSSRNAMTNGPFAQEGYISTDSTADSGDITISAPAIRLQNTQIYSQGNNGKLGGDVSFLLKDDDPQRPWNFTMEASVLFSMDAASVIRAKHVSIDASAALEYKPAWDQLKDALGFTDTPLETFLDAINGKLGGLDDYIPDVYRQQKVTSEITILGKITASGTIDISSAASTSIEMDNSVFNLAVAGAVSETVSKITLGQNAVLEAGQNISIVSNVSSELDISSSPDKKLEFIPANAAVSFGLLTTENRVSIAAGSDVTTTGGAIVLDALTQRSATLSAAAQTGDGQYAGIAAALLLADSVTTIDVAGTLLASRGDIRISAKTDVAKSSLSAASKKPDEDGSDENTDPVLSALNTADAKFKELLDVLGQAMSSTDGASASSPGGAASESPAAAFGLGAATALIFDDVETSVTIQGSASLQAGNDLSVEATTINRPVASASALVADTDNSYSASLTFLDISNASDVLVRGGAALTAGNDLRLASETKIPFRDLHPLLDYLLNGETPKIESIDDLAGLFDDNFGIDSAYFTSWSQTSASGETSAGAGTVSLNFIDNSATTRVQNAVLNARNVAVTATTRTEMNNLVGNIENFFGAQSDFLTKMLQLQLEPEDLHYSKHFQSMAGADGDVAVGAGFLGSFIENTAMARIDGGTVTATGDVKVEANNYLTDLGLNLASGSGGKFGLEGSVGLTRYDSYTLAKIDDGVQVRAGSVSIKALDDAHRYGIIGSFVDGNYAAIGLTAIVSEMNRSVHAVWGNLTDENGTLLTVRGDGAAETLAAATVRSTVAGIVDIDAILSGVNVAVNVSGTATLPSTVKNMTGLLGNAPTTFGDSAAMDKTLADIAALPEGVYSDLNQQFSISVNVGGAVNILTENATAGINGNVDLTTGAVDIDALNKNFDFALTGTATFQAAGLARLGMGGAVALNFLSGETRAFIGPTAGPTGDTAGPANGVSINFTDSVDISADRQGKLIAVNAAIVAAFPAGASVGNAVVVSYADIDDNTVASVVDAALQDTSPGRTGSVDLLAVNTTEIINDVNAVLASVYGNATALAITDLNLNTIAKLHDSVVDTGHLRAGAGNEAAVISIALAKGGDHTAGTAGAAAYASINGDTAVSLDGATITLTGDMDLSAVSAAPGSASSVRNADYYNEVLSLVYKGENYQGADGTTYLSGTETITLAKPNENTATNANDFDRAEEIELDLMLGGKTPKIVTAAASIIPAGGGLNLGLNILADQTFVSIVDSTLHVGEAATAQAKTLGDIVSVGLGDSSLGANNTVAVNLNGGSTQVLLGDVATFNAKSIDLSAENAAGLINVAVSHTDVVGSAMTFAYNQLAHSTLVDVANSSLTATGGGIRLNADNTADVISVLLATGRAQGLTALSINTIGKISSDWEEGVEEKKRLENILATFGTTTSFQKLAENDYQTRVAVEDSTISVLQASGLTDIAATQRGRIISVAMALGLGSADISVLPTMGAAGSYNNIRGRVGLDWHNVDFTGSTLQAGSLFDAEIYAVSAGIALGGSSTGLGTANNHLETNNAIDISDATILSKDSINFTALTDGRSVAASGSASSASFTTGVGAAATTNLAEVATRVDVSNVTLQTTGTAVEFLARDEIDLISLAAVGANSPVGAAVSANVAVNIIRSDTAVEIVDSTIDSAGRVGALALSRGDILSIAGNVALGGNAAIGGSVAYNDIQRTTGVSLVNSRIDARGATAYASGLLAGYEIVVENNDAVLKQVDFPGTTSNILLAAYSGGSIENYMVSATSATIGNASLQAGVNQFGGETAVLVDRSVLIGYGDSDIVIQARDITESLGLSVNLAIGGAFGATGLATVHLFDHDTRVDLVDSVLYSQRNIDVLAESGTLARVYAIGGVATNTPLVSAALAAEVAYVNATGSTGVNVLRTDMEALNDLRINAINDFHLTEKALCVALGLSANLSGAVSFTTALSGFDQETYVNIAGASDTSLLKAGHDIQIGADGLIRMTTDLVSASAAGISLAGSLVLATVKDRTSVNFSTGDDLSLLAGNDIDILARSNFSQVNSTIGGASLGLAAGAAGVEVLAVNSIAQVTGRVMATAGNKIDINAETYRRLAYNNIFAGSGGIISIAGAASIVSFGGQVSGSEYNGYASGLVTQAGRFISTGFGDSVLPGSVDAGMQTNRPNYNTNLGDPDNYVSAGIDLRGTLNAANISLNSLAQNSAEGHRVYGAAAAGVLAAGAAVNVLDVGGNVETKFGGLAFNRAGTVQQRSDTFTMTATDRHDYNLAARAGGVGLVGTMGAAVGKVSVDGNVRVTLYDDSTILAQRINMDAVSDVIRSQNQVDAMNVALFGAYSGAWGETTIDEDVVVEIGKRSFVEGSIIDLNAVKYFARTLSGGDYGYVGNDVYGHGSSALLAGSTLSSTTTILGDIQVIVREGAKVGKTDTNFGRGDQLNIFAGVEARNLQSLVNPIGMDVSSINITRGDALLDIDFSPIVYVLSDAHLRSYDIDIAASELLSTGNMARFESQQVGVLYGAIAADVDVDYTGNNTLRFIGSTVEASNSLSLTAGTGHTQLLASGIALSRGAISNTDLYVTLVANQKNAIRVDSDASLASAYGKFSSLIDGETSELRAYSQRTQLFGTTRTVVYDSRDVVSTGLLGNRSFQLPIRNYDSSSARLTRNGNGVRQTYGVDTYLADAGTVDRDMQSDYFRRDRLKAILAVLDDRNRTETDLPESIEEPDTEEFVPKPPKYTSGIISFATEFVNGLQQ